METALVVLLVVLSSDDPGSWANVLAVTCWLAVGAD